MRCSCLAILVLFCIVGADKNQVHAVEGVSIPSKILPEALEQSDEKVFLCLEKQTPNRISSLMKLDQAERRVRDRLEELERRLSNPQSGFKQADFPEILGKIYAETQADLRPHLDPSGSDRILNAYRRVEASRVLSETAVLLSIIGSTNSEVAKDYRKKAEDHLQNGVQVLKGIDPDLRARELPSLVASLARTELHLGRLDFKRSQMSHPGLSWDQILRKIGHYRELGQSLQEKRELDVVALEAALSLSPSEAGQTGGEVYLDPTRKNQIKGIQESIHQSLQESKSERYLAQARHLLGVSKFYFGDRADRDRSLKELAKDLNSTDEKKRELAQAVATDLMENLGGTVLGRKVYESAVRSEKSESIREKLDQFQRQEHSRSKEYDENLSVVMGKDLVKKLGVPSYAELLHSDGTLRNLQLDYAQVLEHMGQLYTAKKNKLPTVSDEDLKAAAQSVDIHWAYVQCARKQLGLVSKERIEKSPVLGSEFNFSECLPTLGASQFHQSPGAAQRVVDKAIQSQMKKEAVTRFGANALELGDQTLDYLMMVPAGYMATGLKIPIRMAVLSAGKALLRRELFDPRLVKLGLRGVSLGAKTVATDLSVQSVIATREYVEAGLSGNWDLAGWGDHFLYTQGDADKRQHLTRLLVTSVASLGLDSLWGRARVFAPKSLGGWSKTKIGKAVNETAKATVNMTVTDSVGEIAAGSISGCNDLSFTKVTDANKWMEASKDALINQIRGREKKSARYLSVSLMSRLLDLGITDLTTEELQNIERCIYNDSEGTKTP